MTYSGVWGELAEAVGKSVKVFMMRCDFTGKLESVDRNGNVWLVGAEGRFFLQRQYIIAVLIQKELPPGWQKTLGGVT